MKRLGVVVIVLCSVAMMAAAGGGCQSSEKTKFELQGRTINVTSEPPGARVWVAVRPEKVMLAREHPGSPHNAFPGVVKEIAYLGDQSVYLVRLESGKTIRITQPNLRRHADERVSWDERVHVHWHSSSGVVLNE